MQASQTKPQLRDARAPQVIDLALAAGTIAMLAAIIVAVGRGRGEWALLGWPLWMHIAALVVTLAPSPVMLVRARGDRAHRQLGYIWLGAMIATSLVSFLIPPFGQISPIWVLSVITLLSTVRIWQTARQHQWEKHRSNVRVLVLGALLIAGFFTFRFDRLFDRWLSGLPAI